VKSFIHLSLILLVIAGCTQQPETVVQEPVTHDAAWMLNWTCENLAEEFREDPIANPDLCFGYDTDGWPIEDAEVMLPENW